MSITLSDDEFALLCEFFNRWHSTTSSAEESECCQKWRENA